MSMIEVKVPDIGDFDTVPVIELYVKVGDSIQVDESICTLESDKATMDVPSSTAGVVREVLVQVGDKVGEGAVLIKVEATGAAVGAAPAASPFQALPPEAIAGPHRRRGARASGAQGSSTVEPVVLRASRSRWACAASVSA